MTTGAMDGTKANKSHAFRECDTCVIGRGMFGSAAAKHLAEAGRQVCIVGPDERERNEFADYDIFGAHYDEGRITRKTDPDLVWATLAQRSIDRYKDIETRSNVRFYHPCGHLAVGIAGAEYISNVKANAERAKVHHQRIGEDQLRERFPYLVFPNNCEAVHEPEDAGWVSARLQVHAQLELARYNGCEEVIDEVRDVVRIQEDARGNRFEVRTCHQGCVLARSVLVACGAFVNSRPLLPCDEQQRALLGSDYLEVKQSLSGTQVVRLELDEQDAALLQDLPSLIFKGSEFWIYMLPPIKYPDGKIYLKLGGDFIDPSRTLKTPVLTHEHVVQWFRNGGNPNAVDSMVQMAMQLIPSLKPRAVVSDGCVLPYTLTRQLFVGPVSDGLIVVAGCNGFGAKSADEIGRMAALCLLHPSGWGHDLPRERFRPIIVPKD